DGVYPEDMKKPVSEEPGVPENRKATQPVRGKVFFEGSPPADALVTFHLLNPTTKKFDRTGEALVDPDGTFTLSSYTANDGAPVGDYTVTVVWNSPFVDAQGNPGPNQLPERYSKAETSDLRVKVREGPNDFVLELRK